MAPFVEGLLQNRRESHQPNCSKGVSSSEKTIIGETIDYLKKRQDISKTSPPQPQNMRLPGTAQPD
jgi:hypothetical protein